MTFYRDTVKFSMNVSVNKTFARKILAKLYIVAASLKKFHFVYVGGVA